MIRALASWTAIALGLWAAGLLWFVASLPAADHSRSPTDAIVVLTGGRERLHEGLELLQAGKGRKLFVSGVNPEVHLSDLLRLPENAPIESRCCIVLGHSALSTLGNAQETARWMKEEGYKSLRLVTSWYHMPRSLLDFARAMPNVTIIAHPVFPAQSVGRRWWADANAVRLLLREYGKYLVAFGEALLAAGEPRLSHAHAGRRNKGAGLAGGV